MKPAKPKNGTKPKTEKKPQYLAVKVITYDQYRRLLKGEWLPPEWE